MLMTDDRATPRFLVSALPGLIYSLTLFLSASLYFSAQPIISRMVQPSLGGSAAVWTTILVFFQTVLLVSTLYVHLINRWLGLRQQSLLHLGLLATGLIFLPFTAPTIAGGSTFNSPGLHLFGLLITTTGLPFFVLAATSPLLQKWFSALNNSRASDPYYLYSASNLGSLGALLAYPFLIEPRLGLATQSLVWTAIYIFYFAAIAACATFLWRGPLRTSADPKKAEAVEKLPLSRGLRWGTWALISSALMVASTTYITTDLVSVPLLSIPPLALFLLSFVIAFARRKLIPNYVWWLVFPPLLLVTLLIVAFPNYGPSFFVELAIHLATLFFICLAIHGALDDDRPHTAHLTQFYLWIALGGVAGGILVTFVAPILLPGPLEYPILLTLAAAVAPAGIYRRLKLHWALPIAALAATVFYAWPAQEVLATKRSFFGAHRVEKDPHLNLNLLFHGSTIHSAQSREPENRHLPLVYYQPFSPVADVFDLINRRPSDHPVAVVGLGAGTLAAYADERRGMDFFELDPAVEAIARDPDLFTYLTDCGSTCQVKIGDGRLLLEQTPLNHYELIVLDAYSSSTIPTHLLTKEALAIFLDRLHPDGILVFHISNRHLDLAMPLTRLAAELDLVGRVAFDNIDEDHPYYDLYASSSHWLILSRSTRALRELSVDPRWEPLPTPDPSSPLWTDDFVDVLSILH